MNKIILVGRLTKGPDIRLLGDNKAVCTLRVAVEDKMAKKTLYIDVKVWGKQAIACNDYLLKGQRVGIEGKLEDATWEKDGVKNPKMEIIAAPGGVEFYDKSASSGVDNRQAAPEEVSDLEPF